MKVKSTGLGKTQLTAHFDGFTAKEGGEPSAVLIITSTEPVHWHIECDLGGSDLRRFAAQVLRPGMIWHLVKLLARGGEARGFVMVKEGGRRSRKERVTRAAEIASPRPASVEEPTPAMTPVSAGNSGILEPTAPNLSRPRPARAPADEGDSDREERERRRAERRRQREEAARQYVTAG
ncbi:MAG: hypothetical protein M5U22_08690 [Thermoleophilia bacterium]|nr:hypothetical protein [Thermoleophilia bacterium]